MYTVDYFINKFESIPEDKWRTGSVVVFDGATCAAGHCGGYVHVSFETSCLASVLHDWYVKRRGVSPNDKNEIVYDINDAFYPFRELASTPKERMLAALYDIKKMQQPVYEDVTKSLAVLPVSETSDLINQTQPVA